MTPHDWALTASVIAGFVMISSCARSEFSENRAAYLPAILFSAAIYLGSLLYVASN
jgi:hypothetical protein